MRIKKNNEFFKTKDILKDKNLFYILFMIIESDKPLLYSDLKNYCIARSDKEHPSWIWTKDNLNEESILELREELKKYLHPGKNKLTAKKEIYEVLKKHYKVDDYFEMGFLECNKLKDIKLSPGFIDKPNYADKIKIAKLWVKNCEEMEYQKNITFDEALIRSGEFLEDDDFFVWRNPQGKITTIAKYSVIDNVAKISHVYTDEDERCKGYCTSLIYEITKKIINKGLIPVLYTDFNYKASNTSYKKVGYEDKDILINFSIEI